MAQFMEFKDFDGKMVTIDLTRVESFNMERGHPSRTEVWMQSSGGFTVDMPYRDFQRLVIGANQP